MTNRPKAPSLLRFLLAAVLVGSIAGAATGAFGLTPALRIALLVVGLGGLAIGTYLRMQRPAAPSID